ncbi:MAG: hypothetical protein GYB66_14565 [Chloroflexi bacterium]|nr:hypothetical protein [Chloroflexota bacterium]
MKRRIILIAVVLVFALAAALPLAVPAADDATTSVDGGDVVVGHTIDFVQPFHFDPPCPPGSSPTDGGGC